MTLYSHIERSGKSRELDRNTWAGETTLVFAYETKGSGTFVTELLDFGIAYEGTPFFSYGVELIPGSTLVDGDYPFVSAGVGEWIKKEDVDDFAEKQLKLLHTGAHVWISVSSNKSYRLIFRMTFEGIAFKNPQFLR
jgi:hypothetical protein